MTDQDHHSAHCRRANEVLTLVGNKWSVLIVMLLSSGPKRFNELRRTIGGISQRVLTVTLRGLERDGLVQRSVTPSIPPRVDYELTGLGRSLRSPVDALSRWAFDNIDSMDAARLSFDSRAGVPVRSETAGAADR